jgi:hypothetical protein
MHRPKKLSSMRASILSYSLHIHHPYPPIVDGLAVGISSKPLRGWRRKGRRGLGGKTFYVLLNIKIRYI